MKKISSLAGVVKLLLISLLLSNFSASAQKTNIWLIIPAEANDSTVSNKQPGLTPEGYARAQDLTKALKREKIKAIYVLSKKAAQETITPFSQKNKILPRIYADSVKGLAAKILKNFQGNNVLIVGQYNTILPLIAAFSAEPPLEGISVDDYDLLFCVTINTNETREVTITHYGKKHHSTQVEDQDNIQNFVPAFAPPVMGH